jgi:hypothetical protein
MDLSDESPMSVYIRECCKAELAAMDERYRQQLLELLEPKSAMVGVLPKRRRVDFLPPYLRIVK